MKNLLGQNNTSGGGTTSQSISPATTPQHALQQQTPSSSGGGVPWVMLTSGTAMPSNVHVMSMPMSSSQQPTPSPITSTTGNSVPVQSQAGKRLVKQHTRWMLMMDLL